MPEIHARASRAAALGLLAALAAGPAFVGPARAQSSGDTGAPTSRGGTIPTKPDSPVNRKPLGDALSETHGTIEPRGDVDPHMPAPTPPPTVSRMPVVPPPGSPGGDPTIQPK